MASGLAEQGVKITFRQDRCKGCGLCVMACPRELIRISDQLNDQGYATAEIIDMERCNSCAFCAMMCPDVVIEVWR